MYYTLTIDNGKHKGSITKPDLVGIVTLTADMFVWAVLTESKIVMEVTALDDKGFVSTIIYIEA